MKRKERDRKRNEEKEIGREMDEKDRKKNEIKRKEDKRRKK